MTKINDFKTELYYLGKVCKNKHFFAETNNSLRQKSNRTCVKCQKNTNKKYKSKNYELCNERTTKWRIKIAKKKSKKAPDKKQCNSCKELKDKNDFYPAKYSADGLLGHCKQCDKQRQKNRRKKNRKPLTVINPKIQKESKRKAKRRYKKSKKGKLANRIAHHRRKAKLKKVKSKNYTPTQILSHFAKFENQCAYCGKITKLSIDHFIPISKFGDDALENIVPACIYCNSSKNNTLPEDWFKSQTFYSIDRWNYILRKLGL